MKSYFIFAGKMPKYVCIGSAWETCSYLGEYIKSKAKEALITMPGCEVWVEYVDVGLEDDFSSERIEQELIDKKTKNFRILESIKLLEKEMPDVLNVKKAKEVMTEIEEHESNQVKFSIEQYINNFEMQVLNEPQ